MMPFKLVKSDDVRSGRKAKARHGRSRPVTADMGVSGLNDVSILFYLFYYLILVTVM